VRHDFGPDFARASARTCSIFIVDTYERSFLQARTARAAASSSALPCYLGCLASTSPVGLMFFVNKLLDHVRIHLVGNPA
jgi:hypothetical protein